MECLEDSARARASDIASKKKTTIMKKLDQLCRRDPSDAAVSSAADKTEFKFLPMMVYLSSHNFTTPEEEIQNKGMSSHHTDSCPTPE